MPVEALADRKARTSTLAPGPVRRQPGGADAAERPPSQRPKLASAPIAQLRQNRIRINVRLPANLHSALDDLDPHRASFLMDAYHRHSAAIAGHQVPHPGPFTGAAVWGARLSPAFRTRLLNLASDREWTLSALLRTLIALQLDHLGTAPANPTHSQP